jgi:hypothetical protein
LFIVTLARSGVSSDILQLSPTLGYHLHRRPISFDFSPWAKVFYANRGIFTIQPDLKLALIWLNVLGLSFPARILIAIITLY